jgi:hypothetical protein
VVEIGRSVGRRDFRWGGQVGCVARSAVDYVNEISSIRQRIELGDPFWLPGLI